MSEVMKHDKAGDTGGQVDHGDRSQQPHPRANRTQVRVVMKIRNIAHEPLDRLPHSDVSNAGAQRQNDNDASGDHRLGEANEEMYVLYCFVVT